MEFIVLFEDSQTWSSDDAEYVLGNSFVIPENVCTPQQWAEMTEQEISIDEVNPPRISIPEMIRELKKVPSTTSEEASRWDDLVELAKFRAESC